MPCPFCSLEKEKRVLASKKYTYVILSNPRLMPSHLLVLPKRHVEKLSELNEEERKELFDLVIEYQEKILAKHATGCDIRQHYRPFLKQSKLKVNHMHIHLQPREYEDELYKNCQIHETALFKELTKEEKEKFSKV